jgi:hypothetical protein
MIARPRKRYYVGMVGVGDRRVLFYERTEPRGIPGLSYLLGPFRTKRGAVYYRDQGILMWEVQTVAQAEAMALRAQGQRELCRARAAQLTAETRAMREGRS